MGDRVADLDALAGEAPKLRVVVVGHVDHGKSTLIGRIFHDTDSLPEGKLESIQKACELEGMPFEYAFLLDALLEEQAQNITIDTTQIPFRTAKRGYVLVDAPGHKEFLKNMITGAASADAAVLLIAANEGVREQSRRHGYLLRLLGVRQIVVAVNKMDLVGYDRATFDRLQAEYTEFLRELGLTARQFVPVSAREGDNIARHAREAMPWYDGPTILETLDGFDVPPGQADLPLRFVVQDIYRFDARRILAGRIEAGTLRVGDTLEFAPGNKTSQVASFERWHGPGRDFAVAGESVGITLADQLFVERGHVATLQTAEEKPRTATRLRANLFWMGSEPLAVGEAVRLKLATQETVCRVRAIERVIDASTLAATISATQINKNDVAEVLIETERPVAFDRTDRFPTLGRFVLVRDRQVSGGGILIDSDEAEAAPVEIPASPHIVWSEATVSPDERTRRNGHRGGVVWLTGLSGSGKSTIAGAVHRALWEAGAQTTILDGDNLRHGLCADLGFSPADRTENIRRAAHVARLFAETGLVTLASFISPYAADRDAARAVAVAGGVPFIEVHVKAPVALCEERDPKGLYVKARAGQISGFTGIDAPYEAPDAPEITLDTAAQTIEESAAQLWGEIRARLFVSP